MQACVLCSSAMKHKWETDPGEKKLTKHWSESDEARKVAVREISANTPNDDQKGKKQWRM